MSEHGIFVPIIREFLRAIVSDNESCRLLKQALINSKVIKRTQEQPQESKDKPPCPQCGSIDVWAECVSCGTEFGDADEKPREAPKPEKGVKP